MIPYADFTYFGLLLYAAVPTLILGLFGKAGWRWATLVTAGMLLVQYHGLLNIRPHFPVREIWIVIGFAVWQWAISLRIRKKRGTRRLAVLCNGRGKSASACRHQIFSGHVAEERVWFSWNFLHYVSGIGCRILLAR